MIIKLLITFIHFKYNTVFNKDILYIVIFIYVY